jgi:RNA polymerase sigma factor for flagellar operon FliA
MHDPHDPHAEPADEHICKNELLRAANEAIAALPPRLRRVLELHYESDLNLRQIGELLGVSESRACQLRTEAIRRIRELCQDHAASLGAAPPPRAMAA